MTRDDIYSLPMNRVGQFQFDEHVVQVFPDMIARSVPGYASILSMIEQLAGRFVRPGTTVWDLGCSLGAATRLIRRQAPKRTLRILRVLFRPAGQLDRPSTLGPYAIRSQHRASLATRTHGYHGPQADRRCPARARPIRPQRPKSPADHQPDECRLATDSRVVFPDCRSSSIRSKSEPSSASIQVSQIVANFFNACRAGARFSSRI